MPSSPQDWLPPEHLSYQVRDVVSALDLSAIHRWYLKDPRGALPYDPKMMVSLLLYAWCSDVYSSRRTSMLCIGDVGGRYLAGGNQPDFRTVNTFRLRHAEALADLFVQSVRLCQRAGMVSLGHVAVDGTKIAASASKRKAMSYGRMVQTEAELRSQIAEIERRCKAEDACEDTLFGKECSGLELPAELKFRKTRLARILEAKAQIEAEAVEAAKKRAAALEAKRPKDGEGKPPRGRKPKDPDTALPKEKAQRGFTDPESRIMKSGAGEWVQGYNGQAAVDSDYQIIVGCDLTNQACDAPHLIDIMKQVTQNTGAIPVQRSADAGYFSAANVESQRSPYNQTFIPPDRMTHGRKNPPVQPDDEKPLTAANEMRLLLSTPEGSAAYANRMKTVEPVFGQIKGCPGSPGFRHIMRRGLTKAKQEWSWQCAAHNILKYMRHQKHIGAAI